MLEPAVSQPVKKCIPERAEWTTLLHATADGMPAKGENGESNVLHHLD